MMSSGSAEGTTSSAISGGNIIIRDKDSQQQNVDDLSRDTANANGSIGQIFDKEKEQQKIDQAQLIGEISNQATDIARTEGDIAATKAAQEKMKNVTGADRAAALTALEKQGKTEITEADIQNQIYQTAYNEAMNASGLGTGGKYQQMIQAASAAAQGLAGGNMNAAIAGAAAPYVAEAIGHHSGLGDDDKVAKIAAHAVANAVLASVQGQNALAGAAGAATGELMGMIAQEMYGNPVSELSETEKQTISALATIASGIAGGIAGDSTSSALAGAQSGKTTVENNNLGAVLGAIESQKPGTVDKWEKQTQEAITEACSGGTPVSCELAVAGMGTVMSGGILPGALTVTGAVSAGAVAAVDLWINGEVDPKNVIAGYWTGVITKDMGLKGTMLVNAASGATTNYLDGKDPFLYGTISGLGSAIGYGIGNKLLAPKMDEFFNPVWKTLTWDNIGKGVSRPSALSPIPSVSGTFGGGLAGESFNLLASPDDNQSGTKK
ncbi:TPA: filamentous hemagglutinin [Citrobacter freundii]|nr:filamentous hemagglutinin [Citrobacter freundii]